MVGRKFHWAKRYYEAAQLGKGKIQSCVCHLVLDLLEIVTNSYITFQRRGRGQLWEMAGSLIWIWKKYTRIIVIFM